MLKFVTDREIYEQVLLGPVCGAKEFVWLATADLKDLYVNKRGKMAPFVEILSDLIKKNVAIRLLHAKEPGKRFREDFDRYKNLLVGLERMLCPRVHFKMVMVDGKFAYMGSANLTGAGMGAKQDSRRNFENGMITDKAELIEAAMAQFDAVWCGSRCRDCQRKMYCGDCPV